MAGPKISICIPCYNQGAYLEEAIRSCLSQSDDNLEIIVSNNASTDITAEVMTSFAGDDRLTMVHQPSTLPMTDHWNTFASRVTGDWVMLLCADDVLHRHAIAACRRIISGRDTLAAVFFEYDYLHASKISEKVAFYPDSAIIPAAQQFSIFLKGNNFPLSAGLIRRDIIDRLGWFNNEYRFCADWHLWLAITADNPDSHVAYIHDKLFLYRQHAETETLKCIAKRQTIPEVAHMKQYFVDHYVPASERMQYSQAAQLGTKKLARRYAQIATDHGDAELARYYNTLSAAITASPSSVAIAGPPYPLPEGSVVIPKT